MGFHVNKKTNVSSNKGLIPADLSFDMQVTSEGLHFEVMLEPPVNRKANEWFESQYICDVISKEDALVLRDYLNEVYPIEVKDAKSDN